MMVMVKIMMIIMLMMDMIIREKGLPEKRQGAMSRSSYARMLRHMASDVSP